MAKRQRGHHQPRDDFVAHAQIERAIKHVVREAHCRRHGDHFAAQQGQLHTVLALGYAITHGRHAACNLAHRVHAVQRIADDSRVGLIRLVG